MPTNPAPKFGLSFDVPNSGTKGEVFGLDVAIFNFVHNWLKYSTQENFYLLPNSPNAVDRFNEIAAKANVDPSRITVIKGGNVDLLNKLDTVFTPDPRFNNLTWLRNICYGGGFAVCGLAHGMTGDMATNVVTDYVISPTQLGDAIICPSRAIKAVTEKLMDLYAEYLTYQFSLPAKIMPQVDTPVIPIGIDTAAYAAKATAEKRTAQRAALGLADDEVCILFFGRMSYFTKAHPLPLLLAANRAAQRSTQKMRLVLMGFFSPADIEAEFKALAADICTHIKVEFISKDDPRFPDGLWGAADIFTSLVDNYQESYGLTPIESMAAGKATVITDWNGYRDGARHGIEAVQIPTSAPPAGSGVEIAFHNFTHSLDYGNYLAAAAQSVQVDVEAAAQAFQLLAERPEYRQQLGAAGQKRAQSTYDWRVVISAYEALWAEQAIKRKNRPNPKGLPPAWGAFARNFVDPFAAFESFPSHILHGNDVITLGQSVDLIETIIKHPMNNFLPGVLMPITHVVALLNILKEHQPLTIDGLFYYVKRFPNNNTADRYLRTIGWMLKNDFLQLVK